MVKPTYDQVKEKVYQEFGLKVHRSCWVAQVMRDYGLTRGRAWNSGRGRGSPECPEKHYKAIEAVLRESGAIE